VNSTTQTPAYALFVFAVFYVVCAVLVSYMYLRNRAEFYNP
jgi:NNP family nitrate/nitrite transporter-like MFS transporter